MPELRWFIRTLRNGTGSETKRVASPSPAGLVRDQGFGREGSEQDKHGIEKHAVKEHEREPEENGEGSERGGKPLVHKLS
jgi:hypothetical protein